MKDTRHIDVDLGDRSYKIAVGQGLIDKAASHLSPLLRSSEVIVITDDHVAATPHLERLTRSLHDGSIRARVFTVAPGEPSKSLSAFETLANDILDSRIDRKTTVIALGGGVVGDLAGFAAASLLRGLDFIQIPTSLLAMVDSSVGGKTGINARAGKNLIGAFHQPRLVLIDTATLVDLPMRELRCGYAELVKHAFIRDAALFDWLDGCVSQLLEERDLALLGDAIDRSVRIKAAVVAEDETETSGVRALLNFGHTFGHAYEAIAGYDGRLLHGEAVALGMVRAFDLSARLKRSNGADLARAVDHLARAGLPTDPAACPAGPFDADEVIERMGHDKKAEAGKLNFVLSEGIGRAFVARDVDRHDVRQVL